MKTVLLHEPVDGTTIEFDGVDEVRIVVAVPPFSKLTMPLDLDDVDRLLALYEGAASAEADLVEFFVDVFHCPERSARRAAQAFIACAGTLAETVRS